MPASPSCSRRLLLGRAARIAVLAPLAGPLSRAAAQDSSYGPFRVGIQSYSLRGFNLDQALEHTKALGLRYWEAYSAHVPLTADPAQVAALLEKFRAAGVALRVHGVTGFGADAAKNRQVFEAAKALGIRTLSADPTRESLDQLEKLVEEFEINIAIHNHGPGSRYDKLQSVVDAVKDRHRRIGACVDTGHTLRSGENPVRWIEQLGTRVLGVHLKDVKDARTFTVLGKGDLELVGALKALRALQFNRVMSLEYEENPQNPIAEIKECLRALQEAVGKI
jgi:sugar phosphate isomerase/epimerase